MFLPGKRCCFYNSSSELNKKDLHDNREDNDEEEVSVVEESSKNVKFIRLNFTAVNFVKDLH